MTLTVPRGDLRATSKLQPSRWIADWTRHTTEHVHVHDVASHHAGLETAEFPASPTEHRLRTRYAHVHAGGRSDRRRRVERRRRAPSRSRLHRRPTFHRTHDLRRRSVRRRPAATHRLGLAEPLRGVDGLPPRLYFVRYLLRVRPVDEPDDDITITALDRGSAHHDALDLFHRAVIDGELPQPTATGWTDEHRTAIGEFFDHVCDRTERRGRTGRPASSGPTNATACEPTCSTGSTTTPTSWSPACNGDRLRAALRRRGLDAPARWPLDSDQRVDRPRRPCRRRVARRHLSQVRTQQVQGHLRRRSDGPRQPLPAAELRRCRAGSVGRA